MQGKLQKAASALRGRHARIYLTVIAAYVILQTMSMLDLLSFTLRGFLIPICAYVVMAVSLNLTVGIMGELSLGHAGFMSIGAFTGVIVEGALRDVVTQPQLRLLLSLLVGGVCAAVVSLIVVVPVLRLRGDYLAIVTLAFGEIVRNIIQCLYVGIDENGLHAAFFREDALSLSENGRMIIRGPMGAVSIQKLSSFTAGFLLIMATLFVVLNLINSRHGRAIMALRDNRIAAQSLGVSPVRYRIVAFCTSALFAGMAGALYSMNYSSIKSDKFDFNTSILVLVFVVLGGIGNMYGSVIASVVLFILPEMLREYADYRMLAYAVVLIVVMLIRSNERVGAMLASAKQSVFTKLKGLKPGRKGGEQE